MKRVASAVGEGAMSVYLVHRYLAPDLMQVEGHSLAVGCSTG